MHSSSSPVDVTDVTVRHLLDLAHAADADPEGTATVRYHTAAGLAGPELVQELRRAWRVILAVERLLRADPDDDALDPDAEAALRRAVTQAARHIRRQLRTPTPLA